MALQLLYQRDYAASPAPGSVAAPAEGLAREPKNLLRDFIVDFQMEPAVTEYGGTLFLGVCENLEAIDRLIEANARHWKISRMSLVDLSLLRLAVFEMAFAAPRITPSVVIDEAVELAKSYGSTDSASFVNGLLDPIARSL